MKIFKPFIFLLLGISTSALADERIVEVSAVGATRDLAIEAGLIQAVAQVNGTNINSETIRIANQIRTNGKSNSNVAMSNITAMKTKGQITSYEVIDSLCDEECEVVLNVVVPVYSSPGLNVNKRRKLVVAPFAGRGGDAFSSNLQSALVQTRRFAILDRQHNSEYEAEKRLLLSSDTPLKEKMRLGQVLGLDYLVVGTASFEDSSHRSENTFTGEVSYVENVVSKIDYKVINLATRQIKWQDSVVINENISDPVTAQMISRGITSAIYPMKIVSNENDSITLNQGGTSVTVGELYDVFDLGKKLIDPYTKESLGREEIYAGKVLIGKVTSKVSYATVIEGSIEAMRVGAIVRPSLAEYSNNPDTFEPKSTVKASAAGGILIPAIQKKELKPSPNGGVVIDN